MNDENAVKRRTWQDAGAVAVARCEKSGISIAMFYLWLRALSWPCSGFATVWRAADRIVCGGDRRRDGYFARSARLNNQAGAEDFSTSDPNGR